MSITTTWEINDMKRNTSDDGVFKVFWTVWAVREEKYVTEVNGVVELTPDPTSDSFIPYNDLTQDNVISWVQEVLDKDIIEQEAEDKLNRLHPDDSTPPPEVSGIPWSSAE